jgi:hypothetical protein
MNTLREIISENVREGELYEKLDRKRVRCFACGHCALAASVVLCIAAVCSSTGSACFIHCSHHPSASSGNQPSHTLRWWCRSSTIGSPPRGRWLLALHPATQMLTVPCRNRTPQVPKVFPRRVRPARLLGVLGGHIQSAVLPFALIGQVEVRAMSLGRISVADAARVATAARGFRELALDHDVGGLEQSVPKLLQSPPPLLRRVGWWW